MNKRERVRLAEKLLFDQGWKPQSTEWYWALSPKRRDEVRRYVGRLKRERQQILDRSQRRDGADEEAEQYMAILRRDPCCYCGQPSTAIDHIIPIAHGGFTRWDNLTSACTSCNSGKRSNSLLGFLMRQPLRSRINGWKERDVLRRAGVLPPRERRPPRLPASQRRARAE